MKNAKTKDIVLLGLSAAMCLVVTILLHFPLVPSVPFLTYDASDIIVAVMGFLMGPLFALILAVINALLQIMFMGGGPVDVIMNVISTATFAVTAAFIYRRMHTKTGAFIGLVSGTLLCIASMAVWNYVVDPYYFQISQEVVAGMIPAISLFNLIKCGLNAGITLFVYKPVVTALRKAGLAKPSESREGTKGMAWAGAFAALTAAILAASLNGLI